MRAHPDDFMPFLPSVAGEDATDASEDGIMTERGFRTYCERVVSSGDWGGEPEVCPVSGGTDSSDSSPVAYVPSPHPCHPAWAAHHRLARRRRGH